MKLFRALVGAEQEGAARTSLSTRMLTGRLSPATKPTRTGADGRGCDIAGFMRGIVGSTIF